MGEPNATESVTIDLEAGGRMELAVWESDAVEIARRNLGLKLAICRRAGGYSQAGFASLVDYSRSTVANVETGRQRVPRTFWALRMRHCARKVRSLKLTTRLKPLSTATVRMQLAGLPRSRTLCSPATAL